MTVPTYSAPRHVDTAKVFAAEYTVEKKYWNAQLGNGFL